VLALKILSFNILANAGRPGSTNRPGFESCFFSPAIADFFRGFGESVVCPYFCFEMMNIKHTIITIKHPVKKEG
jgi:hypothetical protein